MFDLFSHDSSTSPFLFDFQASLLLFHKWSPGLLILFSEILIGFSVIVDEMLIDVDSKNVIGFTYIVIVSEIVIDFETFISFLLLFMKFSFGLLILFELEMLDESWYFEILNCLILIFEGYGSLPAHQYFATSHAMTVSTPHNFSL